MHPTEAGESFNDCMPGPALMRAGTRPHLIHTVQPAMRDEGAHARVAEQVLLRRPLHHLPPHVQGRLKLGRAAGAAKSALCCGRHARNHAPVRSVERGPSTHVEAASHRPAASWPPKGSAQAVLVTFQSKRRRCFCMELSIEPPAVNRTDPANGSRAWSQPRGRHTGTRACGAPGRTRRLGARCSALSVALPGRSPGASFQMTRCGSAPSAAAMRRKPSSPNVHSVPSDAYTTPLSAPSSSACARPPARVAAGRLARDVGWDARVSKVADEEDSVGLQTAWLTDHRALNHRRSAQSASMSCGMLRLTRRAFRDL